MGVYIKGMEMPKNCNECPMHFYEGQGICSCRVLSAIEDDEVLKPWKKKRKDCPLIEIPPHGRLIDADALDKTIEFIGEAEAQIYGSQNWRFAMKCRQALENAPTIIEAEPCNDLAKPNNAPTVIEAEGRE